MQFFCGFLGLKNEENALYFLVKDEPMTKMQEKPTAHKHLSSNPAQSIKC